MSLTPVQFNAFVNNLKHVDESRRRAAFDALVPMADALADAGDDAIKSEFDRVDAAVRYVIAVELDAKRMQRIFMANISCSTQANWVSLHMGF